MSAIKIAAKSQPTKQALIFLHGLGDSGSGWSFLVEFLQRDPDFAHTKFLFPNAPDIPITVNGGYRMPGWFDILDWNLGGYNVDVPGFTRSLKTIEKCVQDVISEGIDPSNIIVAGFSQGASLSLAAAVSLPMKIGGFMSLSGFCFNKKYINDIKNTNNVDTPLFHGHGTSDPVVPFKIGQLTKEIYESDCNIKGYEFHSYQGLEHSTSPEEMQDIVSFLKKALKL